MPRDARLAGSAEKTRSSRAKRAHLGEFRSRHFSDALATHRWPMPLEE